MPLARNFLRLRALRHRTGTEDQELALQGWHAATNKARELGWIS